MQAEPRDLTDASSTSELTANSVFFFRLAAANAQSYFRALFEFVQNLSIEQSLQIGQVADSLGFIGAALNLAAGAITLADVNDASPSFNDLVNVADKVSENVFSATQASIASLNSKLMGGSPDSEHIPNKDSLSSPTMTSNVLVEIVHGTERLARKLVMPVSGPGFFMLPLNQVLTADVNNTAKSGFEAGVQLVRQQTVMAVLTARNYFVFLDTHRDADACNSITGSRFINNQCFAIEQRTSNFVNCQQDSVVIDKDIVLKLDDPSKPYGFDLNAFYSNVQACSNGQPDTSLDITDDLPPWVFGIPFVTASQSMRNAQGSFPSNLQLPCQTKTVCP
ncbi:hypothetical protein LTR17_005754 [Elasticomyces elasticus]|nr:hypothetical protein LTR17_005754 [Elasticomyces elasticus]